MNDKISVIVPAYNAEKHLKRCIDSILKQTYTYLDIILIDDGSTDSTGIIIDSYQQSDERIRVIHQTNQGLSGARNTGLDNAIGKYVLFVDADDQILPEMVEKLYKSSKKTNADIAICDYLAVTEEKEITIPKKIAQDIIMEDEDKFMFIYNNSITACVQWNKLFAIHIFETLRFPVGYYHEDEFVVHEEFAKANRIVYLRNEVLYIYYILHDGSIMKNYTFEKAYHSCLAEMKKVTFFESSEINNCYLYALRKLNNLYKTRLIKQYKTQENKNPQNKQKLNEVKNFIIKHYKNNLSLLRQDISFQVKYFFISWLDKIIKK